jgi:hypothetical protein
MSSKSLGNSRTFNRIIKDFDLFGHRVQFNFNKNGKTHNTLLGGCFSLVFYVIAFAILLNRLQDISTFTQNLTIFYQNDVQEISILE